MSFQLLARPHYYWDCDLDFQSPKASECQLPVDSGLVILNFCFTESQKGQKSLLAPYRPSPKCQSASSTYPFTKPLPQKHSLEILGRSVYLPTRLKDCLRAINLKRGDTLTASPTT